MVSKMFSLKKKVKEGWYPYSYSYDFIFYFFFKFYLIMQISASFSRAMIIA